MDILAHRGWWLAPEERNTLAALRRAVEAGFGVEVDLRDRGGRLVIAHDPPGSDAPLFTQFLDDLSRVEGRRPLLALNIKADGLQQLVAEALRTLNDLTAYVFDMSVPDTVPYLGGPAAVFVRQSEYEPDPVLYEQAAGVWLDAFDLDWYDAGLIRFHLEIGKDVALVSPELHGRAHLPLWDTIRHLRDEAGWDRLQLCTDLPDEAREYFCD